MKVGKALLILSFFTILFGSCFNPPEFPIVPEIAFQDIIFRKGVPVMGKPSPDSLILTIKFKDGDGDLGLSTQIREHLVAPYNAFFYYQTNGVGGLTPITTVPVTVPVKKGKDIITIVQETFDFMAIEDNSLGPLATQRTKEDPVYSSILPSAPNCQFYQLSKFLIEAKDSVVVGPYAKIDTTMVVEGHVLRLMEDTLYQTSNPNHYNIEVDFMVKQANNTFQEYDWEKEFCTTFDGRFPVLSESKAPLNGKLKYDMESFGFPVIFGGKTLKLRIQIKDRLLHLSNVVETIEFTLESIRK
jgi:hypothetical protein